MDPTLRRLSKTIAWIALLTGAVVVPVCALAANVDIRILIDVSGSMKQNDPGDLRIPAVRLVAELMPTGAQAGIWTFSETIEELVAVGSVDAEWKAVASAAADKIHSRGQFTDIETALTVATRDWDAAQQADSERHVILLTDGMVDVSKQASASTASRKRLLGSGLARIKSHGARIHTIALSGNSDEELLTTLAEVTEGWAEQIEDATSLQRVFLHMFEQAASPDSIPLLDNHFDVDETVSEMTLLVFHAEAAEPLRLINPAGQVLEEGLHAANVIWRGEGGYDLVTVGSPQTGTWRINTEPDPDNRVLIVTDLKLELDALPTNILADESLTISAYVTEHGQPVVRQDFLELLQAELTVFGLASEQSDISSIPLDPELARFVTKRAIDLPAGDYEFAVRVDGGTFQREKRSKIRIHGAPVTFSIRVAQDGQTLEFSARAKAELVAPESLAALVLVARPDGSNDVFDLPPFINHEAGLSIPAPLNGVYHIVPRLLGRYVSGRVLNIKGTRQAAEITAGADTLVPPAEDPRESPVAAPRIDWLRSGAIVLIGNVIVATLLGIVWLMLGRRRLIPSNRVVLQ